eukprot:5159299-Amphidinium_carterae.2
MRSTLGLTRAFSSPWDFSTVRIAELGYGNITAHNQSVLEVCAACARIRAPSRGKTLVEVDV